MEHSTETKQAWKDHQASKKEMLKNEEIVRNLSKSRIETNAMVNSTNTKIADLHGELSREENALQCGEGSSLKTRELRKKIKLLQEELPQLQNDAENVQKKLQEISAHLSPCEIQISHRERKFWEALSRDLEATLKKSIPPGLLGEYWTCVNYSGRDCNIPLLLESIFINFFPKPTEVGEIRENLLRALK